MLLLAGLLRPTALLQRSSANIFKPAATAPIKSPHLRPSSRECLRELYLHGSSSLMETSVWEPLNTSTGTGACRRSRGLPAECEVVRASVRGQHFVRVLKKEGEVRWQKYGRKPRVWGR